jgi:Na+-transporting methylmalonyl-CoA/oxaloacetate decarboxylase beta subunit
MNKKTLFIIAMICMAFAIISGGYLFSVFIQNRIVDNLINQYASSEGVVAEQVAQTLELEIAQTEAKLSSLK